MMYSDFIARYCYRYHESNVFLGVLLVGVNNVNVNELHAQLMSKARNTIPDLVKTEIFH